MVTSALRDLVASLAPSKQLVALESAARSDAGSLLTAFASVGRQVGKTPVRTAGSLAVLDGRGADEAVRAWMLVTAAQDHADTRMLELVSACWARGDNRERHAILRALPVLPRPEQYVPLAIDACRTSVQTVFEAIACENPFPARHFPDLNFNQLVLKAVFTGVALARIEGLERRITPELTRMARGYASERRAAQRSVPPDLVVLTGGET